MISSRGESIAGWGFILWRGSCDLDQTGCHEDHVMCLSIAGRVLFSHVLLYTQESHGKSILPKKYPRMKYFILWDEILLLNMILG